MTDGRIVVVGDLINDIVVVPRGPIRPDTDTTATIRRASGGSAANTAAWLAACGAEVDVVAAVGAYDAEAHRAELRAAGVVPRLQVQADAPTGTIVILVQGAERSMLTERGANSLLRPDAVADALLGGAALLHLSGYSVVDGFRAAGTRELLDRARTAGVPVSVNPGSVGFVGDFGADAFLDAIRGATVLVLNADEARLLSGEDEPASAARVLGRDVAVVALTRGEHGALVVADGAEPVAVPARPVRAVDPTGAGDAFAAGFLEQWVRTRDAVAAARAGIELAARAVTTIGGRPDPAPPPPAAAR